MQCNCQNSLHCGTDPKSDLYSIDGTYTHGKTRLLLLLSNAILQDRYPWEKCAKLSSEKTSRPVKPGICMFYAAWNVLISPKWPKWARIIWPLLFKHNMFNQHISINSFVPSWTAAASHILCISFSATHSQFVSKTHIIIHHSHSIIGRFRLITSDWQALGLKLSLCAFR